MFPVGSSHLSQQPSSYCAQRAEALALKIQNFGQKIGLTEKITLSFSDFNKSASAFPSENVIKLPVWFLFNYEDIPLRFRISDRNDPRLVDSNFLNDAVEWMNQKIHEVGLSSVSRPVSRGALQMFLKLLRDPHLYEKCKDFTIGHELGHIRYAETRNKEYNLHLAHSAISIGGIMGGLLVLVLTLSLLPLVHVSVLVGVVCLGIAISVGGVVAWLNKPSSSQQPTTMEEEKKADLDAVEMLQDASGGIHYFDTIAKHNILVRQQNLASTQSFDAQGNNLNDINHPPLTERVDYLRRWQIEHSSRSNFS